MILFILGAMTGGTLGVMFMCMVQINRDGRLDGHQQ